MPRKFLEYLIIIDTGWTIEYVKDLPEEDFTMHAILAQKRHGVQASMMMALCKKPSM